MINSILPTATPVTTEGAAFSADYGSISMAAAVQTLDEAAQKHEAISPDKDKAPKLLRCLSCCWVPFLLLGLFVILSLILLSKLAPSPPSVAAPEHDYHTRLSAAGKQNTTFNSATRSSPHHQTQQAHNCHGGLPAAAKKTETVTSDAHQPAQHRPSNHDHSSKPVVATLNMKRAVDDPLMDEIGLISDPVMARRIRSEIWSADRDLTGCDIQVLIVDDVPAGIPAKKFATDLFNRWRLGTGADYAHNNGVLILFLQLARRIEVEVGAGLVEKFIDEAWTTHMLQRRAVPEFKEGQYGRGIYNVVTSCAERLRDAQAGRATPYQKPSDQKPLGDDAFTIVIYFVIFVGFWCMSKPRSFHGSNGHYSSGHEYDDGGSSSFDGGGFSSGDGGGGAHW
mmetsp:Transcript_43431/g.132150  ORF Transcript_43431/g.132150 Transcript_43431/m.132150 type:complete len:395 (-) Transcript_43431:195-1379(-)